MRQHLAREDGAPDLRLQSAVLGKSFIRAGENLKLSSRLLGHIAGVSESSVSRIRGGDGDVLARNAKAFELAALFVRMYRSLDAAVGGDDRVASEWLRNKNAVLLDLPINLIQSAAGLVHVIDYLDSRRALV